MSNNDYTRLITKSCVLVSAGVDVDLPGLKAFVAAADELHFGRAAARLFITQQALSKRIRRLEESLGIALFTRTTRRVELTPEGSWFLPSAKEVILLVDEAVGAIRRVTRPLRIDFHDERFTPIKIVRRIVARHPDLEVEPSMRQGLITTIPAVLNGELDAAFGRTQDLGIPWPVELRQRLVHLEPLAAYVHTTHPLSTRRLMRLEDLRECGIILPGPGRATESRSYFTRFAEHFAIPLQFTEPAIGMDHIKELLKREKQAVMPGEVNINISDDIHRISLEDPIPLYPWSIVWHSGNCNPHLTRLLNLLPTPAIPTSHDIWLPKTDLTTQNRLQRSP